MGKRALLLVFVHGFKGDDTTFSSFPTHMCASLGASLPHLTLSYLIYPRFETRGDLTTAVSALRAWLAARVTELQASSSSSSSSPVKVVLVGHSMGGIVAAECALSLDRDCDAREWWPDVQGVLAFDTPYLGIAPGLVAHNAEGHWEKGRLWYQSAAGMWGLGSGGVGSAAGGAARDEDERAAPAPVDPVTADASAAAPPPPPGLPNTTSASPWQRWSRYALYAGAATAAVASTAAAAYYTREQLTTGWTWISSHLEFVGCLARPEELKQRLLGVAALQRRRGLGFANLHSVLGKSKGKGEGAAAAPAAGGTPWSSELVGADRTFCSLPRSGLGREWWPAVNDRAESEVEAHMMMFEPEKNPGYYVMSDKAKSLILGWLPEDWLLDGSDGMQDIG